MITGEIGLISEQSDTRSYASTYNYYQISLFSRCRRRRGENGKGMSSLHLTSGFGA